MTQKMSESDDLPRNVNLKPLEYNQNPKIAPINSRFRSYDG